jgi:hypothetical protein
MIIKKLQGTAEIPVLTVPITPADLKGRCGHPAQSGHLPGRRGSD